MGSNADGDGGEDHAKKLADELSKTLKEGERIVGPTRRPDGTIRKPIRIRAGYTPQDEVPIYIPRGSLRSQEMQSSPEMPPGYDPVADSKPKTKAAKRNERKKEKRQQATLEKDKDSEDTQEHEQPISSQLNELSLSADSTNISSSNSTEDSTPADKAQDIEDSAPADKAQDIEDSAPADKSQDIDKKIRAVKKKIRLAEAQLQKTAEQGSKPPEQSEKLAKIEGWRKELQLLEDKKKAEIAS